jgi:NADPH-dependent curcumin reductase CurA
MAYHAHRSENANWKKDDLIGGSLPFSTVQIVSEAQLANSYTWKLTGLIDESNISYGVGVMGMPGSTAYGGLMRIVFSI